MNLLPHTLDLCHWREIWPADPPRVIYYPASQSTCMRACTRLRTMDSRTEIEVSILDDSCWGYCFFAHQGDTGKVISACGLDLMIVGSTSSVFTYSSSEYPKVWKLTAGPSLKLKGALCNGSARDLEDIARMPCDTLQIDIRNLRFRWVLFYVSSGESWGSVCQFEKTNLV